MRATACTGVDPFLCNPSNFILPIFDYTHAGGRCSITGGYVYRGSQGALPDGTYVYGDFCSGEIFSWNGSSQTLELDTAMSISSFGEDETGEIYVVNLNGSVSRISSPSPPPCAFSISPTSRNIGAAGGSGEVAVTGGSGCSWTAASNVAWLRVTSGATGSGNGTVAYSVEANSSAAARTGTLTLPAARSRSRRMATPRAPSPFHRARRATPRTGGTGIVSVTADSGCDWKAASNSSWISITGEATGSGNGAVTYIVAQREGRLGTRGGRITIAGRHFDPAVAVEKKGDKSALKSGVGTTGTAGPWKELTRVLPS